MSFPPICNPAVKIVISLAQLFTTITGPVQKRKNLYIRAAFNIRVEIFASDLNNSCMKKQNSNNNNDFLLIYTTSSLSHN